jgi:hypothetical protein
MREDMEIVHCIYNENYLFAYLTETINLKSSFFYKIIQAFPIADIFDATARTLTQAPSIDM